MTDTMQAFTHTVADRDVTMNAIMVDDTPWFRANDIAIALGYANTRQAIITHVDAEDRAKLEDLGSLSNRLPLKHNDGLQTFISESGLYALIMQSHKEEANAVKRWVATGTNYNVFIRNKFSSQHATNIRVYCKH